MPHHSRLLGRRVDAAPSRKDPPAITPPTVPKGRGICRRDGHAIPGLLGYSRRAVTLRRLVGPFQCNRVRRRPVLGHVLPDTAARGCIVCSLFTSRFPQKREMGTDRSTTPRGAVQIPRPAVPNGIARFETTTIMRRIFFGCRSDSTAIIAPQEPMGTPNAGKRGSLQGWFKRSGMLQRAKPRVNSSCGRFDHRSQQRGNVSSRRTPSFPGSPLARDISMYVRDANGGCQRSGPPLTARSGSLGGSG